MNKADATIAINLQICHVFYHFIFLQCNCPKVPRDKEALHMIGHIMDQDAEDILQDLTILLSRDSNVEKIDK